MSSPRPRQRLARGSIACQRCRRRKQKCDLRYPSCSNCKSVDALCTTYDLGKQAEIPRDYVSHLEEQVKKLKEELLSVRSSSSQTPSSVVVTSEGATFETSSAFASQSDPTPTGALVSPLSHSNHLQDLVKSVTSASVEPSKQVRFLGPSSGITLAKLVMAAICIDGTPTPSLSGEQAQGLYDSPSSAQEVEASLPPRHAADHLVEIYFQYRTPHLPIVDREQVKEALDSTYLWMSGSSVWNRTVGIQVFTTYMVLAIALCDLPNPISPASRSRPSQSEGCFLSAAIWIDRVITYSKSDIETLRVILILAQFVALNPTRGSLWHLTGTALRLCIDIGLHWETDEQTLSIDPNLLHERRRLWYCTYQFDRVLCITLGRPLGIIDDSTRVPLPSPWTRSRLRGHQANDYDTHNQRAHNHLFSISILESEIKHVQQSQISAPKLSNPKTNYSAWMLDIQPRLQEWYDTVPRPDRAHPTSVFAQQAYWDSMYHNAILLLYRPNSTVTQKVGDFMAITFESSCKLITSIRILQREGKCESLWKTVHHLFMAGLGVVYGLWQSKEIRDRNPIRNSISTLQSCASTLCAMSETFPGASGCRDVFDVLSSATIDFLISNNAEEERQSRESMEKHVESLLSGLHPSRANISDEDASYNFDLSAVLSSDCAVFGEMLSSAAQWPEMQDLNFEYAGSNSVRGMGMNVDTYASL